MAFSIPIVNALTRIDQSNFMSCLPGRFMPPWANEIWKRKFVNTKI